MPLRGVKQARPLAAFSPDGALLAVASPDGRLKTFDTASGRILVNLAEDGKPATGRHPVNEVRGHLFEQHTGLAWVPSSGTAEPSIVLGTAAGDVKAYSGRSGKLLWRTASVNEGGVAAVACASQAGSLLAVGADRHIVSLDAATGRVLSRFEAGRHPLSAVAVAADGSRAFAASAAVAAWDVAEQRRLFKFTGHPSAARALAATSDGQYAASAAAGERHVAVWQASGQPSKKSRSAAGILGLDDPVTWVSVQTDSSRSGSTSCLHVAAISEADELYVWSCSPAAAEEHRLTTVLRVRISVGHDRAERGSDEGILMARLAHTAAGQPEVQVARSSWTRPAYQHIAIPAAAEPASVVLPPQEGGVLLPNSAADRAPPKGAAAAPRGAAAAAAEPLILGPDNAGQPLQLGAGTAEGAALQLAAQRKRRRDGADEAAEPGFGAEPLPNGLEADLAAAAVGLEDDESEEEASDAEPTLGDRVAALLLEEEARREGGRQEQTQQQADDKAADLPAQGIKADSLAVLLTQALRSEDKALLERCLSVGNADIIRNTVSRLQAPDAARFLKAGVARLQSRPSRAQQLVPWLQATVLCHTAYLIAAPGALASLTALYQLIEARLAEQQTLTSLVGRLELLRAQQVGGNDAAHAPTARVTAPQVVYELGDSDNEEIDVHYELASEEESMDEDAGGEGWGTDEGPDTDDDDDL